MLVFGGGMLALYLFFCSLFLAIAHSGDVRRPPTIVKNPVEVKDFRVGEDVKLECVAIGHPTPEYTWYHNDYEIRPPGPSGNIQLLAPGLLQLSSLSSVDEGHYHCMASNQYGSVYSNSSQLRHGKISEGIQGQTSPTNHTAIEGKPYRLECFKANSVPSPIYNWCLTDYTPNDQFSAKQTCLSEDKRIQIDDEGTLHFMYVQRGDNRNGQVYKCNAHNTAVDTTKGGAYARLSVQEQPFGTYNSPPSPIFSSGQQVIALEGQELVLKCFFSGFPVGTMAWTRSADGTTQNQLPSGRVQYSNSGYTLKISRVEPSDAGEYKCSMSNSEGSSFQVISVEVHARPTITSNIHRPRDQNLTEGDTAVFTCNPHAVPTPKIIWYRNMEILNVDNLPMRMTISPDNTRLTVRDVCRDPVDKGGVQDGSDLGVIQCLVENRHGKVFYSGFLNVLKKTKMIRKPSPHSVSALEGNVKSVIFTCDATTDDSTPLSLKWFFNPKTEENAFESIYSYPDKIILSQGNKSLEIKVRNSSDWNEHGGQYKCVADNGYSKVEALALLNVEQPPTTVAFPDTDELKGGSFPWWIILLVCLICLLLLLILLCCWCCYRNRGREYKVDKNERKSGNDPIKELSSTAFADYQRPSTDPLRGSRASLGSSIKMDSDDEGSLNEYGDIDAGKFGEDGSFIGDYNTENRRNHTGYHRV